MYLAGKYEGVVDDINQCISMGGGDSKAFYRRAVAHQHLKQLDKALKDAMDSVRIDPKNKTAIDLVMEVSNLCYFIYIIFCIHYIFYTLYTFPCQGLKILFV